MPENGRLISNGRLSYLALAGLSLLGGWLIVHIGPRMGTIEGKIKQIEGNRFTAQDSIKIVESIGKLGASDTGLMARIKALEDRERPTKEVVFRLKQLESAVKDIRLDLSNITRLLIKLNRAALIDPSD